ncbi:hypothetical protein LIER_29385 [Lithospermum erythrorhizon]|uniref:Uncharacterized protein n=1 Tax=Lithospermum erythrorhizon TaxID=34254 RepID=A0AAV3RJF4_LITER
MSQSSRNQADNFELRPRTKANQVEASVGGGMPIISLAEPLTQAPLPQNIKPTNLALQANAIEVARAEAANQAKLYARSKRNILAGTRPNRVRDNRFHKKCFYALGGMAEGVPRIWTLKEEARGLPIPSAVYMDSVGKLRDEIANIAASIKPQLVDFDDMLMDHPSLFTRVAIITKTKPRESLIPEATSTSPSPTNRAPTQTINPLLKRMATSVPSASQPSKKAKKSAPPKKKATQVLARDSFGEESQAHRVQPAVGVLVHVSVNVVTLDSSTTISDQGQAALEVKVRLSKGKSIRKDQVEANASMSRLPKYTGMYLAKPYEVPNLESMEYITQAVNGSYVLASQVHKANTAFEALTQTKRDAETALASAAAKAEATRVQFANHTLGSFLHSPSYDNKVGSECAVYLHSLVCSTQGKFPDLVSLFNEERIRLPDWYRALALPEDEFMVEEGGEASRLSGEEDTPANP